MPVLPAAVPATLSMTSLALVVPDAPPLDPAAMELACRLSPTPARVAHLAADMGVTPRRVFELLHQLARVFGEVFASADGEIRVVRSEWPRVELVASFYFDHAPPRL